MMAGNITLNPIGEKTRSIASLRGKIVPTIAKCIGIMGGRMQFAPTINRDSKPLFAENITLEPVGERREASRLYRVVK